MLWLILRVRVWGLEVRNTDCVLIGKRPAICQAQRIHQSFLGCPHQLAALSASLLLRLTVWVGSTWKHDWIHPLATPHCTTGGQSLLFCSGCHVSCPVGLRAGCPVFIGFPSLSREPEGSPRKSPFLSLIYIYDFLSDRTTIHRHHYGRSVRNCG